MKKMLLFLFVFFMMLSIQAQTSLNIMSFNIRYNNPDDGVNAWPNRKDLVAGQILFHQADIVGVQEALADQITDLQDRLKEYAYVGVGRDDGKKEGEFTAIFYNKKRFQLLKSETFWLSETPSIPGSKGWDAAITRIVTWAKFHDTKTKKEFHFFNTHFDHRGKIARKESAGLLLKKVKEIAGSSASIITGDFNARPSSEPIEVIMNVSDPLHLKDSKALSESPHYGPGGTSNGFGSKEVGDQPIDYIFVKGNWKVLQHATLSQTWQGRFSSDHFPVFARLVIN